MYGHILRQFTLVLLLFPFLFQSAHGQTLHERSMARFTAASLKVPPKDFTFVVLGDSRDGDAVFERILRMARSYDPLFILHGGDYSKNGSEAETDRFLALVDQTVPEIPLFVVIGNHENRDVFARRIGPFNFTLESSRLALTVVALDNSQSALKRAEIDYLKSRLAFAPGGSFVAMHVPPRTGRWRWHTFSEGADELRNVLSRGQVQAAFFSHKHLFDRSEFGGVPAFITGGAGGPMSTFSLFGASGQSVHHILVVRVKDGRATYSMVPLPEQGKK